MLSPRAGMPCAGRVMEKGSPRVEQATHALPAARHKVAASHSHCPGNLRAIQTCGSDHTEQSPTINATEISEEL